MDYSGNTCVKFQFFSNYKLKDMQNHKLCNIMRELVTNKNLLNHLMKCTHISFFKELFSFIFRYSFVSLIPRTITNLQVSMSL